MPIINSQQPAQNQAQPQQRQQTGSGFVNLQNILQANKNSRLGSAVGGGIQNVANQTQQRIGQASQQFKQQSDQNRLDTDANQQKISTILADPYQSVGYGGYTAQNGQEVAENRNDQQKQNLTQFTKLRQGLYEGPQQIENAQALEGQAQEAQNLGRSVNTAGGQAGLLQRFAAKPGQQYTQGQQKLDTLVLGQAQPDLRQARRSTLGLGQVVQKAETGAQTLAQEYANRAKEFGQQTTGQLGQAQDTTSAEINKIVNEKQGQETERQSAFNAIKSILGLQEADLGFLNPAGDAQLAVEAPTGAGINLATGQVSAPKTPAQLYKAQNEGDAIQKALEIASKENFIDSRGISALGALAKKLHTPVEKLVAQQNITGPEGLLGYGLGTQSQYEYSTAPVLSNLNFRQLLSDSLQGVDAENINRMALSSQEQKQKANALAELGGGQREFLQNDYGQYSKGAAGFDLDTLNRTIDEDLARLRAKGETLAPKTSDSTFLQKLKRTLAPSAGQFKDEMDASGNTIDRLGGGDQISMKDAFKVANLPGQAFGGYNYQLGAETYKGLTDAKDQTQSGYENKDIGDVSQGLGKAITTPLEATNKTNNDWASASPELAMLLGLPPVQADVGPDGKPQVSSAFADKYLTNGPSTSDFKAQPDIQSILDSFKQQYNTPIVKAAAGYNATVDPLTGRITNIFRPIEEALGGGGDGGGGGGGIGRAESIWNSVFCYGEGTEIKMRDGSFKKIEDIREGDDCYLGGKVQKAFDVVHPQLYSYKDTILTGDKAVFTQGKFVKVKDLVPNEKYNNDLNIRVIGIINEVHLLATRTHIGTDVSYSRLEIKELNQNEGFLNVLKAQAKILYKEVE